jgi:hypothetical protein
MAGGAGVTFTRGASLAGSLDLLESYVIVEGFRGYDPYDALTSPLFRLPVLRTSKWLRIAATQALKRLPYNVRPLLAIPKGYNPVTLALVLEASVYRAEVDVDRAHDHRARALHCIAELERQSTTGYSGACWGYPFDWEARYGRLPAGTPTIVATGIVSNALFAAYQSLHLDDALELCKSAGRFLLEDLPRTSEDGAFCWGYYPGDSQRVLNATMKGARLCAQLYSVTRDDMYLQTAVQTAEYVARHQRSDGSWPYAIGDTRPWADNFHTAYVLDAFDDFEKCTADGRFRENTERGWAYYRRNFFVDDRIPTLHPQEASLVDATACGQSLLTLCRFGDIETASAVAAWTIESMQCADGHFAYQVRGRRVNRIPYMRWASAYMYAGLSRLMYARGGGRDVP